MTESGVDQAHATAALESSGWKIGDAVERLKNPRVP
jgi:hypothetical protein